MNIPKDVSFILDKLRNNGYESFVVGGGVRDKLMGLKPKDWDITTSAKPLEVKEIFDHTFDTGIQHGTITVVINSTNYEVTTYRIDGEYEDGRRPLDVTFTSNLVEDLKRRDFTINAIAYHPDYGYQDFFGGQEDIKNKVIKGVGDPAWRFNEDGLRMLRCVRFSSQLGFTIEDETYKALVENVDLIKKISEERVRIELEKLFLGDYVDYMSKLWESKLLMAIDADLYNHIVKNSQQIKDRLNNLQKFNKNPVFAWAIIFFEMESDNLKELEDFQIANRFFKKLKFDNYTINNVILLLKYFNGIKDNDYMLINSDHEIRKLIYNLGDKECVENIIDLHEILDLGNSNYSESRKKLKGIVERCDCCFLKDLKINGGILIGLGVEKGKAIGYTLDYLINKVLENPELNDLVTLKELVINMDGEEI